MKKFICFCFVMIAFMSLVGCSSELETIDYLEYPNSVLAKVCEGDSVTGSRCYGFIDKDVYEQFKAGSELVSITIKHPFKEGIEVTYKVEDITRIVIGRDSSYEEIFYGVKTKE